MRSAFGAAVLLSGCAASPAGDSGLAPVHVVLRPESVEQKLLAGPPQTAGMRSGRVVLAPGASMHRHSTNQNEEFLVFQQGRVRVVLGGNSLEAGAGEVLYIPPRTEHELHNDGPEEARYIYVVAPAGR